MIHSKHLICPDLALTNQVLLEHQAWGMVLVLTPQQCQVNTQTKACDSKHTHGASIPQFIPRPQRLSVFGPIT